MNDQAKSGSDSSLRTEAGLAVKSENARKFALLREISLELHRGFNLSRVLATAVAETGKTLQPSCCFIQSMNTGGGLVVTHEFDAPGQLPFGIGNTLVMPTSYLALQSAKTVIMSDIDADTRFQSVIERQVLDSMEVMSAVSVPILLDDSVVALLGVYQCGSIRTWTDEEVELLETVAVLIAMAMESCRVFVQQQQLSERLANMNHDLSKLYVQLAQKDEQIDRFMHLISHDLRGPVVAISGLVDLMMQQYANEPPDSKPRRYLELIRSSADQVANLTTALVDFARLGRSNLKIESVDTPELVKEIWQRSTVIDKDAHLEVFGALPVVQADRARLGQVFQNLFENAIKYRKPETKAMVDITCQDTDQHWEFVVNDDGIGFAPDKADELFDLFSRLKQARSQPGTGIGLASVLEIARMHGGSAWALGRPEKGSTFHFTIAKNISL